MVLFLFFFVPHSFLHDSLMALVQDLVTAPLADIYIVQCRLLCEENVKPKENYM